VARVAFEKFTRAQRPDLEDRVHWLNRESWPTFLLHGDITHWGSLFGKFADHQILFYDPADALVAVWHTVPFTWDGTPDDLPLTMAGLMERAIDVHRNGNTPNALSALAALVSTSHRRRGLSVESMRESRTKSSGGRSSISTAGLVWRLEIKPYPRWTWSPRWRKFGSVRVVNPA
jgi:hypothetical protein